MEKTKKKVLFTATVDSHILHFHIPYLKMFKNKGYEVHVATNGDEKIPYCDKKHKIGFERNPFKIGNLFAIKKLKKIVEEEKFDIIHCHTPMGSVVTRLASIKARRDYGTRVIYTAHGFHFYKGAPKLNWLLFYPVEKWLSKFTDTLITINQEDYNIAKSKFYSKHVELVHGVGVEKEKFDFELSEAEKEKLREELEIKKDDFVIIYPAELSKRKNQGMLLKCMKELIKENENIKLLLPGLDSINKMYQNMAKNLNIEHYVRFLGYRKDIPKLLKISNLAVSSSMQEGLPVNIIEALTCGLSVIATDCRGNRDLIKNGENGYIVSINDVSGLKNAILSFLECEKKEIKLDSQYELSSVENQMMNIYWPTTIKKNRVMLLRTTSIINDSRVTKEVNTLLKNDFSVKIACWDRSEILKNEEKLTTLNGTVELIKYNLRANYGSGLKNLFKMLKFEIWLYKTLKKNRDDYDIIHSCDLDTGIVANIIANKYNKKLVYDIFDYYVDSHNLPSILKEVIEKQEIKVINNADTTIICGEWRKEQIGKSKPKQLVIIHNTPDIDLKKIQKKESIIKSQSEKIKIVYVGVLQDDRLLKETADILKNDKEIELHIGGFGKYEEYFKLLSEECNNIFFYGSMKYEDVLKLESECDILFATYNPEIKNHKYSAPNKVYEAMALSKPIIVCKNTGIDKFVLENKLGVVSNYSSDSFRKSLNKVSVQKFDKKRIYKLFNEVYNWKHMENILLNEYRRFEGN